MAANKHIKNMVLAALFLALSYVLPYFTGNIPQIGAMLLPMHLPVLLCGFVCGAPWGLVVGLIAPVMRSILTGGFPPMFPTAVAMAFELGAYGFVSGLLYRRLPKSLGGIYAALICAMVSGRILWGVVMALITLRGGTFTFAAFVAGAFTNAVPGIVLQLVAIPAIVFALHKANNRLVNADA
ncbi:MAG: ECF transporter S component [Oscillospiraceae bacterium]|nr:ECF transporter S component [Oscillospiraceae bacterium]